MAAGPRILSFGECSAIIDSLQPRAVIDAIADGFIAFSRGLVSVAPIQTLGQPPLANFIGHPDAQACIKSAYVNGGSIFVAKVASGGGGLNSGLVLVFSQINFAPTAVMLDGGYLTELRTAAAGALAAKHFAPTQLDAIAVIGCGVQARWQLRLLASVVRCRHVRVWARRPEQVRALVSELSADGWQAVGATSIESACVGAGLIVTVTCARDPLVLKEWIPGGHDVLINAIGADSVGKQELELPLVASAALVLADSKAQCIERGEVQHAVRAGLLSQDAVVEIGAWLDRPKLQQVHRGYMCCMCMHSMCVHTVNHIAAYRTSGHLCIQVRPRGVILFDSTGVAVQDVKIAELALAAAPPPLTVSLPTSKL